MFVPHFVVGEVAPLLPFIPLLAELLFWVGCAIFIVLVVLIVKALFGATNRVVGWIPYANKIVEKPLHDIEKKIVGVMSAGLATVDAQIGASLHAMARLVDWIGREIKNHSNMIWMLAQLMLGQNLAGLLRYAISQLTGRVHSLERQIAASLHRVIQIEERLRHGIGEDVLPRIRGLEREVDRTIAKDLRGIRAREKALERGAAGTWKWIRHHPNTIASGAFAGAVAWALGRLGATWLRCNNVRQLGRRVCGMDPSAIEGLLADTLALVGTVSLLEFIRDAQAVEDVALEALGAFIREMPGG